MPPTPTPIIERCDTVGAWRDGELVVVSRGAALPDRCIKTNDSAAAYLTSRIYWHRPAWYLALTVAQGLYVIYLLMFAENIELTFAISGGLKKRRRLATIGASAALVAGLFFAAVAGQTANSTWAAIGYALMFSGVAAWTLGTRVIRVRRIESGYAWIGGVHRDYLACLPEWQGSPNKRIDVSR